MVAPGQIFGKFRIEELLGRGGCGEVWKAHDTSLQRPVALKFLRDELKGEAERFQREARIAALLFHPNIAAVYEVVESDGRVAIVMQYVRGRSMAEFPRNDRRMLVQLLRDAASAVHHAHAQSVVHRDLKPGNLMVEEGPAPRVYVMDFGLARRNDVARSVSVSGIAIGTPVYMPPEQAAGESADVRSDVYGLGATLYELLTGRPPFAGEIVMEILVNVLEGNAPPPRSLDATIDADLDAIVMKCLAMDRDRRYASAEALALDLQRWLDGAAVDARPRNALERLVPRRRGAWLPAVGLVALVALGIAVPLAMRARAETRRREALLPLRQAVDAARANLTVPGDAVFERLRDVEEVLSRTRAVTAESDGEGWHLLGEALELVGDSRGASEAYARSLEFRPGSASTAWRLGRLALERKLIGGESADGAPLLRAASGGWAGVTEIEWVAVKAALALAENRSQEAAALCGAGLAQHGERPGAEELWLLLGWSDGDARNFRMAVARRPHFAAAHFMLGRIAHRAGDGKAAIESYDRAVRLNPRLMEAFRGRGEARLEAGDIDGAVRDYDVALRLAPGDAVSLAGRALSLIASGRGDLALADADAALKSDRSMAIAWNARGMIRMATRDFPGALEDFQEAIRLAPKDPLSHANRGRLRHLRGDPEGAVADLSRSLDLKPGQARVHHDRATARLAKGDPDGALADLNIAVRGLPKDAQVLLDRALVRRLQKDVPGAMEDLGRAVQLRPGLGAAWRARGELRVERREASWAIEDLTQAIDLDPKDAVALLWRARAKRLKGDVPGLLADLDAAVAADGSNADARLERAYERKGRNNPDGALADYDAAIRVRPKDAVALANRGLLKRAMGDAAGAMTDFDDAILADATFAPARFQRGNLLNDTGRMKEAIEDYEAALKIDNGYAEAVHNRGIAKERLGDRNGAFADFDLALKLRPFADAYVSRGRMKRAFEDLAGAIADYSKAIELMPHAAAAYFSRGNAKRDSGDREGAIEDFTLAIRYNARYPEARANRAMMKKEKGDRAGAIADLEAALEMAPRDWKYRKQFEGVLLEMRKP